VMTASLMSGGWLSYSAARRMSVGTLPLPRVSQMSTIREIGGRTVRAPSEDLLQFRRTGSQRNPRTDGTASRDAGSKAKRPFHQPHQTAKEMVRPLRKSVSAASAHAWRGGQIHCVATRREMASRKLARNAPPRRDCRRDNVAPTEGGKFQQGLQRINGFFERARGANPS